MSIREQEKNVVSTMMAKSDSKVIVEAARLFQELLLGGTIPKITI